MPVKQQQQLNLSQTNSMFMSLLSKAFIKDNNSWCINNNYKVDSQLLIRAYGLKTMHPD